MLRMEHGLAQAQTQRLMLTQRMQQAIQILQLSRIELEQYVQQELETNPVLEQVQEEPESESKSEEPTNDTDTDTDSFDDGTFNLDDYSDQWKDPAKLGPDFSRNPDMAARQDYYENSITQEESFSSKLMTELRCTVDNEQQIIGERIIGDIDNRGYFTGSLEKIAEELNVEIETVERVLYRIQHFEPAGVGARDVIECLLIQINVEYPDEEELKVLVSEHLEALEHRLIPKIAKAMEISPERVEELKNMLSTLDPWPGHEYSLESPQYVAPDLVVEKIEGEYIVYLTGDGIPGLLVADHYRKLTRDDKMNKDDKQYVRDKVESAKWLIRNIEQRQQTILKIGTSIMRVQEEFLDKGVEAIRPLTLQEIADDVGVHEATVSRTTRGKYIQTPQGLFELKYFFSPGLRHDSGEAQSSRSVKSIIKKIIEREDKAKPLSDQKIANLLKEQGINIARRTVAKYRESMGILTTTLRKSY